MRSKMSNISPKSINLLIIPVCSHFNLELLPLLKDLGIVFFMDIRGILIVLSTIFKMIVVENQKMMKRMKTKLMIALYKTSKTKIMLIIYN